MFLTFKKKKLAVFSKIFIFFYITSLRGWCVALHFYYSLFYSTRFLLNISFLSLLIIQTCSKHRHNIGKLYFDWKFWKKKKISGKNFGQHQSFFYSDSILNFAVTQPNISVSSQDLLWFIWLMKLEHEHTLSKRCWPTIRTPP